MSLDRERLTLTSQVNRKIFTCGECPKTYKYVSSLKKHERAAHNITSSMKTEEMTEKERFDCQNCGRHYLNKSILFRHLKKHMVEEKKEDISTGGEDGFRDLSEPFQDRKSFSDLKVSIPLSELVAGALRVLHSDHFDILYQGRLLHVKNDGATEFHELEDSVDNPSFCSSNLKTWSQQQLEDLEVMMFSLPNENVFLEDQLCVPHQLICEHIEHIHNKGCGHIFIYHNGHIDYIVEGRLHHPHTDHCDDHGAVVMAGDGL
eukprot:TRINITY_DN6963_c0_g1_i1.p1 TRINITY_DN6963_c0_g1~~TRINITY_DN6963_c0_g1_i1.p1  ORF type:complete len:261 (-),score=39.82 TRINITY_DN6963_c0_g1_i1:114-896(-)